MEISKMITDSHDFGDQKFHISVDVSGCFRD